MILEMTSIFYMLLELNFFMICLSLEANNIILLTDKNINHVCPSYWVG